MHTVYNNTWHKRNELQNTEDIFVFHSPHVFVQFSKGSFPDVFGAADVSNFHLILQYRLFRIGPSQFYLSSLDYWINSLHNISKFFNFQMFMFRLIELLVSQLV